MNNIKLWGISGAIALVISLVVSGLVGSQPATVDKAVLSQAIQEALEGAGLGAASGVTRYPNSGISAQFIQSIGTTTQGGTVTGNGLLSGGLMSTSTQGTCVDATTTIFRVQNPFAATATVDRTQVVVTGSATSSLVSSVGTTTPSMTFAPAGRPGTSSMWSLPIWNAPIDTGLLPVLLSGVSNDRGNSIFSHSTSSPFDGSAIDDASTTPVGKIAVAPNAWVVGYVFDKNAGGVTAPSATSLNNTFACTYDLLWTKF